MVVLLLQMFDMLDKMSEIEVIYLYSLSRIYVGLGKLWVFVFMEE